MPNLGPTELIIIGLILVLLFGAKKLPDAARGLGRSLRIFKAETSKLHDDPDAQAATTVQAQPQPAAPAPQPITPAAPTLSAEEQARALEEQAARLRAQAGVPKPQ
ncbi:sec-independent protein translocase protein TatA [Streptosporangium album]|uniref:Sec-independent protein translocase protein TatA n=1 Tax=Streptosporangium album TaxID=47479 RepID=A0A7W7S194_9ACTN|nr:Sec-independent protein translocase subunit TatA [Streptosporangium album]MBB4942063.1 sec-independent protein translocase protein TatA [Streptosporangium album]